MSAGSILLVGLALAFASTACQPPAEEAGPLSEEDLAAIEASLESFAQAIRAWLEPFPPIEYEGTVVEIDGRGDLAFVRGNYSETYTVEGAPEPIHHAGKYVKIWRRQPDGSWLIAVEIWNSDLPLAEEGAETYMPRSS